MFNITQPTWKAGLARKMSIPLQDAGRKTMCYISQALGSKVKPTSGYQVHTYMCSLYMCSVYTCASPLRHVCALSVCAASDFCCLSGLPLRPTRPVGGIHARDHVSVTRMWRYVACLCPWPSAWPISVLCMSLARMHPSHVLSRVRAAVSMSPCQPRAFCLASLCALRVSSIHACMRALSSG